MGIEQIMGEAIRAVAFGASAQTQVLANPSSGVFQNMVPDSVPHSSWNHEIAGAALRYYAGADNARHAVWTHNHKEFEDGHLHDELGGPSYAALHGGAQCVVLLTTISTGDATLEASARLWLRRDIGMRVLHAQADGRTYWPGNRAAAPSYPSINRAMQAWLRLPREGVGPKWQDGRRSLYEKMVNSLLAKGIDVLTDDERRGCVQWIQGRRTAEAASALQGLLAGIRLESTLSYACKGSAVTSYYPKLHGGDNVMPGVSWRANETPAVLNAGKVLAGGGFERDTDEDAFYSDPKVSNVSSVGGRLTWIPRGVYHKERATVGIRTLEPRSIPITVSKNEAEHFIVIAPDGITWNGRALPGPSFPKFEGPKTWKAAPAYGAEGEETMSEETKPGAPAEPEGGLDAERQAVDSPPRGRVGRIQNVMGNLSRVVEGEEWDEARAWCAQLAKLLEAR